MHKIQIFSSKCRITIIILMCQGDLVVICGPDIKRELEGGVCVSVFKGVRGYGEVLGGPVVVTSDLLARSRASQKPLQMCPAWEPPRATETERERERASKRGRGSFSCHRCHRDGCTRKSTHKTSTQFVAAVSRGLLTTIAVSGDKLQLHTHTYLSSY